MTEHPSQLNQRAAARAAVIRANKLNRIEGFRVVMRANEIELFALWLVGPARDQVDEMNRSARGLGVEGLVNHLPASCLQLLMNVSARLFNRLRFRRARAESDQRPDMGERSFAGKFPPRFRICARRFAACQDAEDGKSNDAQENCFLAGRAAVRQASGGRPRAPTTRSRSSGP